MVELPADRTLVLDLRRPGDGRALLRAAEEGRDLLGPFERRVERPGPTDRVVRIGLAAAPGVVPRHLFGRRQIDVVERYGLVEGAHRRALGRGAVVAADVDDDGVVGFAQALDGLNHAADFVVGVGEIRAIHVRLLDEELLFHVRELIPRLDAVRPGRQLGIRRDHAEALLIGEDLLADRVVALVEQVHVADLLDPLRRRMVRRVRAARRVVDEERQRRIDVVDLFHPADGLVGHRGREVPPGIADEGRDRRGVAGEHRFPLAAVTGVEPIEVIETHAGRPLSERAGLAGLERRRIVVLAVPGGAVAVLLQDLGNGGVFRPHHAVVAGEARRHLRDHAEADRMVIAPGQQRRTRRRAQRR